jgi:hypothetical protein
MLVINRTCCGLLLRLLFYLEAGGNIFPKRWDLFVLLGATSQENIFLIE